MSAVSASVLSDKVIHEKGGKGRRKYTIMMGCSFACVLIGIVLIFAIPPFIQNTIVQQSIDQVIMKPEN